MELCLVNFKGDGSNSAEGEISIFEGTIAQEPLDSLELNIFSERDPFSSERSKMLQLEPKRGTFEAHINCIEHSPGISSKNWPLDFAHMGKRTKETGQIKLLVGLIFSLKTHDTIAIILWLCRGHPCAFVGYHVCHKGMNVSSQK